MLALVFPLTSPVFVRVTVSNGFEVYITRWSCRKGNCSSLDSTQVFAHSGSIGGKYLGSRGFICKPLRRPNSDTSYPGCPPRFIREARIDLSTGEYQNSPEVNLAQKTRTRSARHSARVSTETRHPTEREGRPTRPPASRRTYFTDDAAAPHVLNPQRSFVRPLLAWHEANGRHQLPWRETDRSAFEILIAEILLQRTTAASVAGAYLPIIARYPSPETVVAARPEAIERRVAPLGLAKRTEFIYRSAERLLARHSGDVPRRYEDLLGLHGVGVYTARSVLIHAFNEDIAAVDTNVRRLISRFFDVSPDSDALAHLADALTPSHRGSEFQHAMLDFAADVCTAHIPECESCPLRERCRNSEHDV